MRDDRSFSISRKNVFDFIIIVIITLLLLLLLLLLYRLVGNLSKRMILPAIFETRRERAYNLPELWSALCRNWVHSDVGIAAIAWSSGRKGNA